MGSSHTGQMTLDCFDSFFDFCLPLDGLPAIVDAKNRYGAERRVRPPRLYPVANLGLKGSWADHTLLFGSTV